MTEQPTVLVPARADHTALAALELPCYAVRHNGVIRLTNRRPAGRVVAEVAPLPPERLGSARFRRRHRVRLAYHAGAMAAGIASTDLVGALARVGCLASFGAAGLPPEAVEAALGRLGAEIPGLPFAGNLVRGPAEARTVDLYLRAGVRCVEASGFLEVTPDLVRYRLTGLYTDHDGRVAADNRVIAKVSRPEVAARFFAPPPAELVAALVDTGQVTVAQARLARHAPLADDVTVEADSGGYTDRRPLSALLPAVLRLRNALGSAVGVGAAGGIGTPDAVAGAFATGADYVVTGSVNQSCHEAGTSPAVRRLLALAGITDFVTAPAADRFEHGAEIQVLRTGFPARARRLYELYRTHPGVEAIPADERAELEREVLRRPVEHVWRDVVAFFARRDQRVLDQAARDPKLRMALVFRWYLGMATRWATTGDRDRADDYQVWCGPAVGGFNDWAHGTYLADPDRRGVVDVANHLMAGAAFATRVWQFQLAGVALPAECREYRPRAAA
ncbi:PfaD family polyunsaturated fatty acid/polyketide biosynthesis protein [Actinophytocola sediminis]